MRFVIVVLLLMPFGVHSQELDLTGANFAGKDLSDTDFTGAVVVGADFRFTGITPEQLASTASYQTKDLRGTIFSGTWNLRGGDFTGQDLTDSDFRTARLDNANFSNADLTNALFLGAKLANANFSGADLSHAQVGSHFQGTEGDLTNVNFSSATLVGTTIGASTGADFTNAVLQDTILSSGITLPQLESTMSYQNRDLTGVVVPASIDLTGKDFSGWTLAGARLPNLSGAQLNGADLSGAWLENLKEANLSGANVRGAQFQRDSNLTQEQLKSSASYQSKDLAGVGLFFDVSGWDLSGVDLTEAHITNGLVSESNFSNTKLANASLWSSKFNDVSFQGADLAGSNVRRSTLANVDMSGANLTDVDFANATLSSVILDGTDLRTVNLSGVRTISGSFRGANLSGLSLPSLGFGTDLTDAIVSDTSFQAITEAQLYSTQSYKNQNLRGVSFGRALINGWNLSGQDLRNVVFPQVDGVNLRNANLADASLSWGDIRGTELTGANIVGTSFIGTFEKASDLSEEQLQSTASYQEKDLRGVQFLQMDIRGWDFSGQNLTDAMLDSEVTDADFTGAIISGIRFKWNTGLNEEQLQSTASYQAKDLSRAQFFGLDVSGWDLSGFDLSDAWLRNVNLSGTNLADAKLAGVNFDRATLRDVDLSGFDLQGADFGRADLTGVDMTDANAAGTSFNGASTGGVSFLRTNLTGATSLAFASSADLTDAVIDDALIDGITEAQLQSTKNFKDQNLRGTNFVGVDFSNWNLSEQDLRGAAFGTNNLTGLDLRGANLEHAVVITSQFGSIVVDPSTTYDQWTVFRTRVDTHEEFDPSDFRMTFQETQAGDFDANGDLDSADIDSLQVTIRELLEVWPNNGKLDTASPLERFDLDEDGFVTEEDTSMWLDVTGSTPGDTNLDGMVDFADFLTLSDGFGGSGNWSDGDFDGDGMLAFGDFLLLADNFGNEVAANATNGSTVSSVPEAAGSLLAHFALIFLFAVARGSRPTHEKICSTRRR